MWFDTVVIPNKRVSNLNDVILGIYNQPPHGFCTRVCTLPTDLHLSVGRSTFCAILDAKEISIDRIKLLFVTMAF